jgi:hypothetical protein
VTDRVDEEDCEGGIEEHLEDRVDSDEDYAVLGVTACEAVPDQNLSLILQP